MRLIDADKLFNDMYNMCNSKAQFIRNLGEIVHVIDVLEQIMNTPTVDAVEVVRCKDCKYHDNEENLPICIIDAEDNDYCSWGERREDEAQVYM